MQIQINWSQVLTSLILGGILGGIAILRLSDSQTITLAGQGHEIEELKSVIVPRGEYNATILRIDQRLESLERSSQNTNSKLDRLLERN